MITRAVDLLVIGGGMAGCMAAATAARNGLSVVLVRKSYGATALSSGAIDFPPSGDLPEAITREACAFFQSEMASLGYAYEGDVGQVATLLTALGTCKRTTLYPSTTAAGRLDRWAGDHVLYLGIRGLAEFNAAHASQAANYFGQRLGRSAFATGGAEMDFPRIRHKYNILGCELAQLLEDEEIAGDFAVALRQAVEEALKVATGGSYTRVALPPIVGMDHSVEIVDGLTRACGLPCFELLSGLPSLLGLRLQNALDRILERHGVKIIHGVVGHVSTTLRRITRVTAEDKDAIYTFLPQAVVLASGKFIGGGLAHAGRLVETIFGLPLWLGEHPLDDEDLRSLSSACYAETQPFMTAGVRTDAALRPLGQDEEPAYRNLWAAGAILQGQDYAASCGNLGSALVTGYRAGQWISERG